MDVETPATPRPETDPEQGGQSAPHQPRDRWLFETLVVVVIALVVAVVLRTFVIGTYSIPSGSMEPTLEIGDRIVVDKLSYDLHGVHRGNIVVFATPKDEHCAGPPVANLVKRVIGLPGETISLSGGQVYINGKLLAEPWLPAAVQRETVPGPSNEPYSLFNPYKIPQGDVFVMGDNRTNSCDSRYWGPIRQSTIVGQVDVRLWPLSRLHWF